MSQLSVDARPPLARATGRWSRFPWSLRGAAWVLGITAAALLIVVAFSPSVNTADLQRRDRLTSAGQFVDATYRYFLGRPADGAGLAEYESVYDRDGPRAIALAIIGSREFESKHPDQPTASDADAMAAQFVQLYESGALQPAAPIDWPGRVGFVLTIALAAGVLLTLQRLSARSLSGGGLHIYLPRWFVVGLFAALAGTWFLNTQALFYTFGPGAIGYAEWLERLANLAIGSGLAHMWTPYPQATPMLLVMLDSVANVLAGWLHSDVWTSYTLFRWMFQAVFLLIPSVLVVSITYRMGMFSSPAAATLGAGIVAFSFAPLYYGVASTVVTDPLPVCVTLLGVWFALRRRPAWAGLALGLAAAMKLIPVVVVLPAVVLASTPRARWTLALVPVVVLACVFVPFLLSDSEMFWSPFRWQAARPPWESLYAFVNWLGSAPHEFTQPAFEDLGVGYNFGWVFWGITPPLTALTAAVPAPPFHWENMVAAIGTGLSLLVVFGARSREPRALARWSLYALAITFLWSPGWSPQYELYLVPLIALAFESPLVALGAVVALEVPTFLEYPLFLPWAYFYGGSAVWLAWAATVSRYLVLAWLALYVLRAETSLAALRERLARSRRALAPIAAVVSALGVLAVPANAQTAQGCGFSRPTPPVEATALGDLDWQIPGGWFFTETATTGGQGYSVRDDASAQMWSEFQRLGGWRALGFPSSQRFLWHGVLSQAAQRAVLQWSPVTGRVGFANVLDLIHEDGRDAELADQMQIPPPLDVDEAGLPYETIAANRLGWLDARSAIKAAYCNVPGGGDPLELWGLPTSQVVDVGADVYVLRTQRAAFQEWVNGAPFAAPGEVTVVLAGDLAKTFSLLPPEATTPELPP